jgi:DNA primase
MAGFSQPPRPDRYGDTMGTASSHGKRRLQPVDFDALKATVSIVELLESIGWKYVQARRGGNELRGRCPIHNSSSQTSVIFSVTPSRNIFKCFKCNAGGDTIALAAYLFGIARDQRVKAAVELCKQLGIEIPRLPSR